MPIPHPWALTPAQAIDLQTELSPLIDFHTPIELGALQTVAGVDVSVKDGLSRAAVVVLSFPGLEVIEFARAEMLTPFPYIPGLLSFREGQAILAAQAKLKTQPDVYLFDGMGRIHPRRFGVACHLGLWLGAPTIGCGKTHYLGVYDNPGPAAGDYSLLYAEDPADEVLGVVLRTKDKVKPVYISVGHRATLETARALTLACTGAYRLPEPIRWAHHLAGQNLP